MTLEGKCQYIYKTTLFRHKSRGLSDVGLGYTLDRHFKDSPSTWDNSVARASHLDRACILQVLFPRHSQLL